VKRAAKLTKTQKKNRGLMALVGELRAQPTPSLQRIKAEQNRQRQAVWLVLSALPRLDNAEAAGAVAGIVGIAQEDGRTILEVVKGIGNDYRSGTRTGTEYDALSDAFARMELG